MEKPPVVNLEVGGQPSSKRVAREHNRCTRVLRFRTWGDAGAIREIGANAGVITTAKQESFTLDHNNDQLTSFAAVFDFIEVKHARATIRHIPTASVCDDGGDWRFRPGAFGIATWVDLDGSSATLNSWNTIFDHESAKISYGLSDTVEFIPTYMHENFVGTSELWDIGHVADKIFRGFAWCFVANVDDLGISTLTLHYAIDWEIEVDLIGLR